MEKLSICGLSALSLFGVAVVVPGFVGGLAIVAGLISGACWVLSSCTE